MNGSCLRSLGRGLMHSCTCPKVGSVSPSFARGREGFGRHNAFIGTKTFIATIDRPDDTEKLPQKRRPPLPWLEGPGYVARNRRIATSAAASIPASSGSGGSEGSGPASSFLTAAADFAKSQFLPLGLVSAMTIGVLAPDVGAAAASMGLQKYSTIGIFLISGLMLKAGDAKKALQNWRAVLFGVGTTLAITPLLGGIPAVNLPGLSKELGIGLAVFACMPTSLSTCVTMTQAVGANTALALLMVVITNTLGIFTMPFILCQLLSTSGVALQPSPLLVALVQNILIPLSIGAAIRSTVKPIASWVDANKKSMSYASTALLCFVPWMQISQTALAKPDISAAALAGTVVLGALMHAVFLGFNIGAARTLQLGGSGPEAQCVRRPVILCGSQKTLPVAVTTINTLAAQMDLMAGVAVLPCVFSHFSQIVIDSFLTSHWIKKDKESKEDSKVKLHPAASEALGKGNQ